jgi:hypothetical protein
MTDWGTTAEGAFTLYVQDTDAAGNVGSANMDFFRDTVVPTLTTNIVSSNTTHTLAKVGDTITLTITASEALTAIPTVTIDGQSASVVDNGSNVYAATYTLVSGDTAGTIGYTITNFSDLAGNPGVESVAPAISPATTGAVLFDKTAPAISYPTNGNAGDQGAEFTQTGLATDGGSGVATYHWIKKSGPYTVNFTAPNSAVTNVSATGAGYYTIELGVTDAAGNTASSTASFTWGAINVPILSYNPVNGATGVAIADGTSTVTFGGSSSITLLDASKITLVNNATGDPVNGAALVDTGNAKIIDIPYTGLVNSTVYRINIMAGAVRDDSYHVNSDGVSYFTTVAAAGDTTAPVVSVTATSTTQTTASITFSSGEAGTAKVGYGLTASHGNMTSYASMVAADTNTISLSGLTCNTTYHYTVYGKDSSLNEANTADDATFTTSACAEPTEISSSARLIKRIATKDGVYADGWKWILDVTLPTASSTLQLSFDNLTGAGTILASSSIRFYSAQFVDHTGTSTAISVVSPGAGTAWSDAITLSGDTSSNPGRQIEITVEAAVPSSSPDGYYSASYDLQAFHVAQ